MTDFDRLTTDAWFDYNLQKMVSISAGMASTFFTQCWDIDQYIVFDSRVFNIPKEEVCNYFIWRQQDWTRNSLQMLARCHYSHKELHGKNSAEIHDMLYRKDVNWTDLDPMWKNGTFVVPLKKLKTFMHPSANGWEFEDDIVFSKDRDMVERFLETTEE